MLQQERPRPPDGAAADDLVVVGRLTGAYGIKGWIRVVSFTDPIDNLESYRPWSVRRRDGWRRVDVAELKAHGSGFVAKLVGVESRDDAERLTGSDVGVPASVLPPAGPDEYYWKDLVGLDVVTPHGRRLGRVVRLMETGAHDVLVVAPDAAAEGDELLIPFVAAIVGDVDLVTGRLVADWDPDGGASDDRETHEHEG